MQTEAVVEFVFPKIIVGDDSKEELISNLLRICRGRIRELLERQYQNKEDFLSKDDCSYNLATSFLTVIR